MARNIAASKRGFGYDPVTRSLGIYVDGALTASFPSTPGRTYYVNNITGSSTNDGLSWSRPFAQPQQAINAADVFFKLTTPSQDDDTADNQWIRNTIIIQGTSQYYEKITATPNCCTMIGIGTFGGQGSWGSVATVHSATNTVVGDCRGWSVFNLRFESEGGTGYYIFKIVNSLGMQLEDCALMAGSQNGTSTLSAAIGATGSVWAGHTIRNCRIGGTGGTYGCDIGIDLAGVTLTTWNNCRITGSIIEAKAGGIGIKGHAGAGASGTLIDNNHIFGDSGVLTAGVQCSTKMHVQNNFISATDGVTENASWQAVGNEITTT